MKLNAISVAAIDTKKSAEFYTLLGFRFPEHPQGDEQHLETIPEEGLPKLMIDNFEIIKNIIGEKPMPSNHSNFAIQYDSADEVNQIAQLVAEAGYTVFKEPWDAPWGQRYAIVEDPYGYKVDLYAII